jgi:hypothetical protein
MKKGPLRKLKQKSQQCNVLNDEDDDTNLSFNEDTDKYNLELFH